MSFSTQLDTDMVETCLYIMCRCVYDCLHTNFHMSESSNLLAVTIKPKARENFCIAAMLLLYILQKN
jgi:S-adenosylmethionine:tRNA-ribosyltransferase-isomerase (queuine synthetase)